MSPLAKQGLALGFPRALPARAASGRVPVALSSRNPAPRKKPADPFPSSALADSRIRAGQWWDSPLHLMFCLLFWTPRFEPVPNEAKINFLTRCHKYSTWEGGTVLPVTAVSECRMGLYLALYFPCTAAASSSDKAVCCSPDPCSRIPRIRMLVRGGAELSKGFFCLMQTQNYLGHDLSRAGKNARPAAVAEGELAELSSRPCGKRMWNFSLRWAALRELLCLFPGANKSEKVL